MTYSPYFTAVNDLYAFVFMFCM